MDEMALIQSAQRGDLEAFNRLVLHYQDVIFTQAYRMMGESEAAEDATQEAFISAYRSLRTYRGGSFKAWLLRIVTNACYDELRRRKRHPTTSLQPLDGDDDEIETPRWLRDHSESPEEQTERHELGTAIRHCLDDLSPEFRAVVILVDIQGMDYGEASAVTQTPIGTIKSRLARARMRLRDCLGGLWELLPAKYRLFIEDRP